MFDLSRSACVPTLALFLNRFSRIEPLLERRNPTVGESSRMHAYLDIVRIRELQTKVVGLNQFSMDDHLVVQTFAHRFALERDMAAMLCFVGRLFQRLKG